MDNIDKDVNEIIGLLRRVSERQQPISKVEKKQIKNKIKQAIDSPEVLANALLKFQTEESKNYIIETDNKNENQMYSDEEIIANNYIELAKFAIKKLNIAGVKKLKVEIENDDFKFYALTHTRLIELDIQQIATSDYQYNKELLIETRALQADLFMEDSTKSYIHEIISRIENSTL